MSKEHAPEMELQQYALDKNGCPEEAVKHIEACESCRAAVAAYRLVIAGIDQQPKPAFDFDVSALVLTRLAQTAVAAPLETPIPVQAVRPVSAPALAVPGAASLSGQRVKPVSTPAPEPPGAERSVHPVDHPFRIFTAAAIFFITGVPAWLFRKNIFYTFTGISSFFLYTIVAAALVIVALRIAAMYRRYQRRMDTLLYY